MIRFKSLTSIFSCFLFIFVFFPVACHNQKSGSSGHPDQKIVPFGWPFENRSSRVARGGTTKGTPVTRVDQPGSRWHKLQEKDLSKKERDRRAILAMTGSYRVSFQFLETMGFTEDYEPPRPYFSWATEYIHVLEAQDEFIRLQHTLVMYFEKKKQDSGPMIVKHWRQDWRYEDRMIWSYRGDHRWEREKRNPESVEDKWSQTVYQVDDSLRYEAVGKWVHQNQFSTWVSNRFRRPLPRREFSIRDDYELLDGQNRITITPRGWVHEQNNRKQKRSFTDERERPAYIAKEYGINRYELISEPDLAGPAQEYWKRTDTFWKIVREEWAKIFNEHTSLQIKPTVKEKKLHKHFFSYTSDIKKAGSLDEKKARAFVQKKLQQYVKPLDNSRDQ